MLSQQKLNIPVKKINRPFASHALVAVAPWNGLHCEQAYLKGPLAVTERADVSGCELFDYGLAGELLLHHFACESTTNGGKREQ